MTKYSKFLGQQPHGRCDSRSGCCGSGSNEVKLAKTRRLSERIGVFLQFTGRQLAEICCVSLWT